MSFIKDMLKNLMSLRDSSAHGRFRTPSKTPSNSAETSRI